MHRSGFTTIEMLIVIVLIGAVTVIMFPKIRQTLDKTSVRAARVDVTTYTALAKASAVRRGCSGVIHFSYGAQSAVWVTACPRLAPGGGTVDTVASIDSLARRYSVSITSTSDSLQFDPRGLEMNNVITVVRFTGNVASNTDSVVINPLGKVVR